jgi:predicted HTH domain antitoxin
MSVIQLELKDELAAVLQGLNRPLTQTVVELVVLELYRRGAVSSGKAAELVGMSRWELIRHASRLGISYFEMTEEEWEAERRQAEAL